MRTPKTAVISFWKNGHKQGDQHNEGTKAGIITFCRDLAQAKQPVPNEDWLPVQLATLFQRLPHYIAFTW